MNQIGINKQQKTQKNAKKINFVIFVKSVGNKKIYSLLKHKLIINLKTSKCKLPTN